MSIKTATLSGVAVLISAGPAVPLPLKKQDGRKAPPLKRKRKGDRFICCPTSALGLRPTLYAADPLGLKSPFLPPV